MVGGQGRGFLDGVVGALAYENGTASSIDGITASADGTSIAFRLTKPDPIFPTKVSLPLFQPVPLGTPMSPVSTPIASAGAYYVASYAPGASLVLKQNPSYGGKAPHNFAEIDFALNVPTADCSSQVERGLSDYAPDVGGSPPCIPAADHVRLAADYGPGSTAAAAGRQQYFIDAAEL